LPSGLKQFDIPSGWCTALSNRLKHTVTQWPSCRQMFWCHWDTKLAT